MAENDTSGSVAVLPAADAPPVPWDFPPSLTYGEIKPHNADYRADMLRRHYDLYVGGDRIRERLADYLVQSAGTSDKRGLDGNYNPKQENPTTPAQWDITNWSADQMAAKVSADQWALRKKLAWYVNHAAGLVDGLISHGFRKDIELDGAVPEWESLAADADGCGTSLAALCRQAMLDLILCRRPWFAVRTLSARDTNERRFYFRLCRTSDVDDWSQTATGFEWVRLFADTNFRTKPYGPEDWCRHIWTYYTPTETVEYVLEHEEKTPPQDGDVVPMKTRQSHGFGRLPVFPIRLPGELCIFERLNDPVLRLFNAESGHNYALYQGLYPVPVAKLNQPRDIIASGGTAVLLKAGVGGAGTLGEGVEDFRFEAPNPQIFDSAQRYVDAARRDLAEVLNALAQNAAATQTQNARQAASAKEIDKAPYDLLVAVLVDAVVRPLQAAIDATAKWAGIPAPVVEIEDDSEDETETETEAKPESETGSAETKPETEDDTNE